MALLVFVLREERLHPLISGYCPRIYIVWTVTKYVLAKPSLIYFFIPFWGMDFYGDIQSFVTERIGL